MSITLRDNITFPFNGGRGILTSQLDGAFVTNVSNRTDGSTRFNLVLADGSLSHIDVSPTPGLGTSRSGFIPQTIDSPRSLYGASVGVTFADIALDENNLLLSLRSDNTVNDTALTGQPSTWTAIKIGAVNGIWVIAWFNAADSTYHTTSHNTSGSLLNTYSNLSSLEIFSLGASINSNAIIQIRETSIDKAFTVLGIHSDGTITTISTLETTELVNPVSSTIRGNIFLVLESDGLVRAFNTAGFTRSANDDEYYHGVNFVGIASHTDFDWIATGPQLIKFVQWHDRFTDHEDTPGTIEANKLLKTNTAGTIVGFGTVDKTVLDADVIDASKLDNNTDAKKESLRVAIDALQDADSIVNPAHLNSDTNTERAAFRTKIASAPLDSPTFTGTVLAPTPVTASGTTVVATKGYVDSVLPLGLSDDAVTPQMLDADTDVKKGAFLTRIDALQDVDDVITPDHLDVDDNTKKQLMRSRLGAAGIDSPTFNGTPKAPTPLSNGDNTQIATKKYVDDSVFTDDDISPAMLDADTDDKKDAFLTRLNALRTDLNNIATLTVAEQRARLVSLGVVIEGQRPTPAVDYNGRLWIDPATNITDVCRNAPYLAANSTALWGGVSDVDILIIQNISVAAVEGKSAYSIEDGFFYESVVASPGVVIWDQVSPMDVLIDFSTTGWSVVFYGAHNWDSNGTDLLPHTLAANTDYFFFNRRTRGLRRLGRDDYVPVGSQIDHWKWEPIEANSADVEIFDARSGNLPGLAQDASEDQKIGVSNDGFYYVHLEPRAATAATVSSWATWTYSSSSPTRAYGGIFTSDPSGVTVGYFYYNSTSRKFRIFESAGNFFSGEHWEDFTHGSGYPTNFIGHYSSRNDARDHAAQRGITTGSNFLAFTGSVIEQATSFTAGTGAGYTRTWRHLIQGNTGTGTGTDDYITGLTFTVSSGLVSGLISRKDGTTIGVVHAGELAALADPTFTGIPKAPTPLTGGDNTQIATKKYVDDQVSPLAPKVSPVLTGTPTAPTPLSGGGDTEIATKKYVDDNSGTTVGSNSVGSGQLQDDSVTPAKLEADSFQQKGAMRDRIQAASDSAIIGISLQASAGAMRMALETDSTSISYTGSVIAPIHSPALTGNPITTAITDTSLESQIVNKKYVDDNIGSTISIVRENWATFTMSDATTGAWGSLSTEATAAGVTYNSTVIDVHYESGQIIIPSYVSKLYANYITIELLESDGSTVLDSFSLPWNNVYSRSDSKSIRLYYTSTGYYEFYADIVGNNWRLTSANVSAGIASRTIKLYASRYSASFADNAASSTNFSKEQVSPTAAVDINTSNIILITLTENLDPTAIYEARLSKRSGITGGATNAHFITTGDYLLNAVATVPSAPTTTSTQPDYAMGFKTSRIDENVAASGFAHDTVWVWRKSSNELYVRAGHTSDDAAIKLFKYKIGNAVSTSSATSQQQSGSGTNITDLIRQTLILHQWGSSQPSAPTTSWGANGWVESTDGSATSSWVSDVPTTEPAGTHYIAISYAHSEGGGVWDNGNWSVFAVGLGHLQEQYSEGSSSWHTTKTDDDIYMRLRNADGTWTSPIIIKVLNPLIWVELTGWLWNYASSDTTRIVKHDY